MPELQDLALSSKIKAKPKLKDGVETIKVSFNFKVKLSIDGESMTISVRYKGEGTRVE